MFVEAAQALAQRVLDELPDEPACVKIERLVERAFGRDATTAERNRLLKLYNEFCRLAQSDSKEAAKLCGSFKPSRATFEEAAAFVGLARTLLNLDEFVTRD